jgi:antitoxin component of RelBE/YafQ-DinJ toxin-antitoxin module
MSNMPKAIKKRINSPNNNNNNNNVVVENINTTTKQYLVGLLKNLGITASTASKLVLDYPQKSIIAQVEMLPYRQAQNPAGMLIKAIKENWAPPQGYREFQEQKARQRAEDERRAKEEARRKARQQKIVAIKAKMSEQELQALREKAEQEIPDVLKDAYSKKKLPLPEILIESQMNDIIGREYLT